MPIHCFFSIVVYLFMNREGPDQIVQIYRLIWANAALMINYGFLEMYIALYIDLG